MKTTFSKLGNVKRIIAVIAILVLTQAAYIGYLVAITPTVIRKPLMEHYHFRMQIIVDGQAEDFSTEGYQVGYSKDQCNANLPEQPIHFHDEKDQIVHIHWEGITGGMVLKYYGWNYIGGPDNSLGYKTDKLTDIQNVTTHGKFLPELPQDAKFYIYTGSETGYKEKDFNDWKNQDLEEFFGVESNAPIHKINKAKRAYLLDKLFPKASAHGTADDADGDDGTETETEEDKLTRINNLIGNVVIFVQNDPPNDAQIKEKFSNLEPLTESTCGG